MTCLRSLLFLYGLVMMLCMLVLSRQLWAGIVVSGHRKNALRGSIEGWLLLAVAFVVAVRYVLALLTAGEMPGIEEWLLTTYASGCGVYIGAKAVRAMRVRDERRSA